MRSSKGVFTLNQVVVFAVGSVLVLSICMLYGVSNSDIDRTTQIEIDYQSEQIRKRSTVDTVLADKMWRSPDISRGEYNGMTAEKLLSYYFSTDSGSTVYIGEKEVSKQQLKNDIERYLKYKLDTIWVETTPQPRNYRITVSDQEDTIEVESSSQAVFSQPGVSYEIGLKNGERADLRLLAGEEVG